jgi:glycerol uptake facilitator-like aquaporin
VCAASRTRRARGRSPPALGNWVGPFIDQVVGTAFLLAFVFALTDERNQPPRANLRR